MSKIEALLKAVRREDLEALAPAHRERFAAELRHLASIAIELNQAAADAPKSGVLSDLRQGYRGH